MRIVTWNMAFWSHRHNHERAWRYALEELRSDVLLCQEAVPPDWVGRDHHVVWSRAYPRGQQPWGTGLVTMHRCRPARIPGLDEWFSSVPTTVPGKPGASGVAGADGWLATARVDLPIMGEMLLGSVHSPSYPIEKARLAGIDVSAMKLKLNPDLWFLDVLFFFLRRLLGTRLIVGGDFNYSRLLDPPARPRGNSEFFDRLRDEGFVSLHRLSHEADERTFFQKNKGHHQLDYLYTDATTAGLAGSCSVHPYAAVADLSDHAPLIADFPEAA